MRTATEPRRRSGGDGPLIRGALRHARDEAAAADGLDRRKLLSALSRFQRGDFAVRLPEDWSGLDGKIADAFNGVVETNQRMARELERLSRVVGKEGRISQRARPGS